MSSAALAPTAITSLLHAWQAGDRNALGRLLASVETELRRMAASRLRGAETPSLARDDLLQEALIKLMATPLAWNDRGHFFATLSKAMRSVMVDHARARHADKRGGQWAQMAFTLSAVGEASWDVDLLNLDQLLKQLEVEDARAAQVLQLTYFGGLQREDIATVMGVSVPTVDRELRFARAWLADQLGRPLEA